jgi:hypothetical protein
MNTYLARLVALVRNKLTPSANTLIANFRKMEAKIEATIAKETARLDGLYRAEIAIKNAKMTANAELDAVYKLLHNLTGLTK